MKFLLPHRCKKAGALFIPSGLALWSAMQLGYVKKFLLSLFGDADLPALGSLVYTANVAAAILGFFLFLGGIYLVTFSKEKIEDEMVRQTRLESFQFAAIVQIVMAITGFVVMVLVREPGKENLLLFFVGLILLFWLAFVGRFNYILHVKLKDD